MSVRGLDAVATAVHVVHGTRGLIIGSLGLLVLTLVDPLLPADVNRILVVAPVFTVLVLGASTLAREGVAVQQRAQSLVEAEDGAQRLARTLVWPALLCVLLAPRLFLGAYGIPHMSPLTGLILPAAQQRLALVYLFLVLLVAATYIRATSRYARHIVAKRPRDLSRADRSHQERDGLLWMSAGLAAAYAWLLHPFWTPFSLIDWPPAFGSLMSGARGVASITFSLALPLVVFTAAAGHLRLLLVMARQSPRDDALVAAAGLHVVLSFGAAALHAYDLLWIAQYRAAAPF